MKKQSFAKGAALLAVAIGLGKIFSAVFKIPLDRIFLHADGMAIFNSAYNVYMLFFSVATAGIPMAISSLIAASDTEKEESDILSTSLIFIQGVLIICALVIFIFAGPIARLTGIPESAAAFRIMSPALLFCGITASLRGFFQGKRAMTPPALSQVVDSFARLIFGFGLVWIFSSPLHISAGAAMSGVPFGALLSALVLVISFLKLKRKLTLSFSGEIVKKILFLAMPITLTSSLHPIFNMADTVSVVPILSLFSQNAQIAFGCLSRSAMIYALPVSIASAVSSSILPAVSENIKNESYTQVNRECSLAIRLAIMISAPCSAGFMAISSSIFNLLYGDSLNHMTLVFIAPSAVLLSVGGVMACILQGMQKTKYTVFSASFAICAKILLNPLLIYFMDINGAAMATSISYFVFLVALTIFILRHTPVRFSFISLVLKPFVCSFLCFITAFFASQFFDTTLAILLAAIVYVPSVFLTGVISFKEFKQIFSGS